MRFEVGQKYILKTGFFSNDTNRIGEEVEVVERFDEQGDPFLAFVDKLGVSIPVGEKYIK